MRVETDTQRFNRMNEFCEQARNGREIKENRSCELFILYRPVLSLPESRRSTLLHNLRAQHYPLQEAPTFCLQDFPG